MRPSKLRPAAAAVVRDVGAAWQGVAGAVAVTSGVLVLAGYGWALVTVGGFLLLGAWGSR